MPMVLNGRFRLTHEVAHHGQQGFWDALDEQTGRRCTVVSVAVPAAQAPAHAAAFETYLNALSTRQLPATVPVLDGFVAPDGEVVRLCLVHPALDGRDVASVGSKEGFNATGAATLVLAVARTLDALHTRAVPVIHGGIQPHAVWMDSHGGVLLCHPGAFHLRDDGTAAPPNEALAPATDIRALGLLMAFALTGNASAHGTAHAQAGVPADLRTMLTRMQTAAHPRAYASMREVVVDLERFLRRARRRTPVLAAAMLGMVVGVGAIAAWAVAQPGVADPAHPGPSRPRVERPLPSNTHRNRTTTTSPQTQPMPHVPGALLPPRLAGLLRCHMRTRVRPRDSMRRYLSWADAETGPTCQERHIYGLYGLYEDSVATCRQVAAMRGAAPTSAALEDAVARLAAANAMLTPLVARAEQMYSDQDYQADACAQARSMHPPLMSAFRQALDASHAMDAALAALLPETLKGLKDTLDGDAAGQVLMEVLAAVITDMSDVMAAPAPQKAALLQALSANIDQGLQRVSAAQPGAHWKGTMRALEAFSRQIHRGANGKTPAAGQEQAVDRMWEDVLPQLGWVHL